MVHTRTKIIVGISAAFLLASVSAFGIFFYKLEMQKAAYNKLRADEAEQTARRASLAALVETLDSTRDARVTLAEHFLTDSGVVDLLALIETLGRETGVILSTDALEVHEIDERFEELVATISVEGQHDSVMRMLELFEYLPYETQVRKVDLQQATKVWEGTFQVHILKFKAV